MITIDLLKDIELNVIYKTWKKAFADYYVDMSYLTIDRMQNRARMDRVNYNLSVGAFYLDELIGFLIIGIDEINNELCAFDAGTGVIPEFQGKGIAGSMFNFAITKLKSEGVKKFILEVIQDNHTAIKAYKKQGFLKSRDFNCYKIETGLFTSKINNLPNLLIKRINKKDIRKYINYIDWEISWEYNIDAIHNIQEELIIDGAFINGSCVGFITYYPTLQWIFILAVKKEFRRQKIGSLLLAQLINKLKKEISEIKINNILPNHEMCLFLEMNGFKIYTTQYEMIFSLKQ